MWIIECHFDNLGFKLLQGENVPAPFMSFEAVGFPPDMLREVLLAFHDFWCLSSMGLNTWSDNKMRPHKSRCVFDVLVRLITSVC